MGKILRKWNYKKHDYEPYEVPDDWKLVLYTDNMDEITTCPHCGKAVEFGETYTSKEIHTETGFGYPVCGNCYEKEWDSYRLARESGNDGE
jgi:hypothetical protein